MRIEKVPVDMSSEQKEILGILSKRQLTYLAIGGLVLYSYVPVVFNLLAGSTGWIAAAITALVTAMPTIGIIFFFGFTKVEKYNMNRDYYYWIKIKRKSQYGSWRK